MLQIVFSNELGIDLLVWLFPIAFHLFRPSTMIKLLILYISHQNKGEQIAVERTFHSHEYI